MLTKEKIKSEMQGVWTALVTPFTGQDEVNREKVRDLVSFAVESNITGVVALGSTGESASLNESERDAVIQTTIETAENRIKVMVGAGTNNTPKTIENVKRASNFGADAVLIVTPYYNKPTPRGLNLHFTSIAEASEIPIVLYNIPSRCGIEIPLELVLELAEHPNIIGIKEAGGDVIRSGEIARQAPDNFVVLSGDDPLTLPLMSVGAVGVIAVMSNIAPKLSKSLVDACLDSNFTEAKRIHYSLAPLLQALSVETNPAPIKETMNIIGFQVGDVRLPLVPVTDASRRIIIDTLDAVGELS